MSPTPEDTMTEYKELAARLRPNWKDDDAAGRAVSVLRSISPDLADKLNAAIVANNALKAEAASAIGVQQARIEALEAERDEAKSIARDALDGFKTHVSAAEASRKRLEAQVEQAFRDGLAYATNVVVTDADEAWRTSRARLALQENTNGG